MSSCGNPTVETDALMPRRLKFDKSKTCVKCKTSAGNVVVRHAVYCKDCFFVLVTSKFRRSLDPFVNPSPDARRTKLKAAGNLLIGFSGGLGSSVLLDLVSRCYFSPGQTFVTDDAAPLGGRDHPRNTRVWKKATACYVEISNAVSGMRDRTGEVRAVVEKHKEIGFIHLHIEDAFDNVWWEKVGGKPDTGDLGVDLTNEDLLLSSISPASPSLTPIELLRTYLSSLPTQTAVLTAIQTLVRLLLLYTARDTSSSHLLLGTSLTSLSISLISSIAQGGGFVVREEAHEEWVPDENAAMSEVQNGERNGCIRRSVRITRPLRDVGMKECEVWAWWKGLEVIRKEKFPGTNHGISGLTKDFIVGLERDYPSTVSTIARTCAKLVSRDTSGTRCALCERPAQRDVQAWKSHTSIRSFWSDGSHSPGAVPPVTWDALSSSPPKSQPSLTPLLCYACHTTLTSRSSRGVVSTMKDLPRLDGLTPVVTLPVWVRSNLLPKELVPSEEVVENNIRDSGELWGKRKMEARDMENVVADFLLEAK